MTVVPVSSLMRRSREAAPAPASKTTPNLASYDIIVVSTSAGKDSQAAFYKVVEEAKRAGVLDRVVAIHADLAEMEWPGTKTLAKEQADHFGVPLIVVSRIGTVSDGRYDKKRNVRPLYAKDEVRGDLLDDVTHRKAQLDAKDVKASGWFSRSERFCTKGGKTGPILAKVTELVEDWRESKGWSRKGRKGRACRVLDVMGLRAEESSKRAARPDFETRKSNSRVHMDTWLPIHGWLERHVWDAIAESGAPYHEAYDFGNERGASLKARKALGMKRLSCMFCVFASRETLLFAAKYAPRKVLDRYCDVEKTNGYFTTDKKGKVWLTEVRDLLDSGVEVSADEGDWGDMG